MTEATSRSLEGKTCLVLGAGGFIGWNLIQRLRSDGAAIIALDIRPAPEDCPADVEWVEAGLNDRDVLADLVKRADTVFHLAASSTPASANADPAGDVENSVLPALGLLDMLTESSARLVFVSSGGTVYGPEVQVPTPETAQTDPINAYGVGKLAIEKYIAIDRRQRGLDAIVLRVANPYGPHQNPMRGQGAIAAFLYRALNGEPIEIWGTGEVIRDYVYIGDVAAALSAAASYDGSHALFNVGGGGGLSLNDIIGKIEPLFSQPIRVERKPGRVLDVPASILDISRASEHLKWRPVVDINTGLGLTLDWLRERFGPAS
jgi:UDP-glucose 4-epimerase